MNYAKSIIYGIIQGFTEFLPVSSSGHLVLLPWLFGWDDPGLAFDVALHWGTLLGVVIYYRKDVVFLTQGFIGSLKGARTAQNKLPWLIILATIPAVLAGLSLEELAETHFRSPQVVATMLILIAFLLLYADRKHGNQDLDTLTVRQAFLIGLAQALAIVPGTSRSGITITMALFLCLNRSSAVRFSFLMSIPIILGAGILKLPYLLKNMTDPVFLTAIAAAALSGFLAIKFLVHFVKTKSFLPFVIYRWALAAVIIFLLIKQA